MKQYIELRNRSSLAVNCCVIIFCLDVWRSVVEKIKSRARSVSDLS